MQRGLTLEQNAQLFALLNLAEADAGIIAWDCKYAFNFWRPLLRSAPPTPTAIPTPRRLDVDAAAHHAEFFPNTFPATSTFSATAAIVLTAFSDGRDVVHDDLEDLPGVTRHFDSFTPSRGEAA